MSVDPRDKIGTEPDYTPTQLAVVWAALILPFAAMLVAILIEHFS
jgi:hypothetical protein